MKYILSSDRKPMRVVLEEERILDCGVAWVCPLTSRRVHRLIRLPWIDSRLDTVDYRDAVLV